MTMPIKILYLSKKIQESEIFLAFRSFFRHYNNLYIIEKVCSPNIRRANSNADLIIAEDNEVIQQLQDESKFTAIPVLSCCYGNDINQIPPLIPNLFGILCFTSDADLYSCGIPSKLIYIRLQFLFSRIMVN
jgi:hypothetical protein